MGSLMAGWASPVQDERKGEFGGYCDEEAVGVVESAGEDEATVYAAESSASHSQIAGNPACCMQWALFSARPACRIPRGEQEQETIGSKPDKTGDWWTRSNWAFLNEPPRDEMAPSAHNYTAQFDVANLTTTKKLYTSGNIQIRLTRGLTRGFTTLTCLTLSPSSRALSFLPLRLSFGFTPTRDAKTPERIARGGATALEHGTHSKYDRILN
uniref:Uncharacterized protein n=1 Tax=Ananas comosus var. bracteatus TaxID=296719 RepID=A0A6V7PG89_ANACO|nr:unnamed protein product [Ananas comosus var. bracteatus]